MVQAVGALKKPDTFTLRQEPSESLRRGGVASELGFHRLILAALLSIDGGQSRETVVIQRARGQKSGGSCKNPSEK